MPEREYKPSITIKDWGDNTSPNQSRYWAILVEGTAIMQYGYGDTKKEAVADLGERCIKAQRLTEYQKALES